MNNPSAVAASQLLRPDDSQACQSIEWYSEGQSRVVELADVRITIRFVGRRGRRARIAITAPPGTVFRSAETEVGDGDSDSKQRH